MRACHVRCQHPALPCTLSRTALNASRSLEGTEIVCHGFRPCCCWRPTHASLVGGAAHTHTCTTCSLAEALGRKNCLVVGAGQTLTRAPHARLPKHWEGRIVSLLALVRHPLLARFSFSSPSLAFFRPAFFHLRFPLSRFSPHRTYLPFVLYLRAVSAGVVRSKLTPPHWRTVTMTTRALSKKAGVGSRERLLLRKNGGRLQSS